MPKFQAILTLEFEADSSDQAAIDLELDQILLLQPSCRIISKTICEIDDRELNPSQHRDHTLVRPDREGAANGIHGDSYRPVYSDNERAGYVDRHARIDSHRSYSPPERGVRNRVQESTPIPSNDRNKSNFGTRYDALVDSMTSNHEYLQSLHPSRSPNIRTQPPRRTEHYSPPPARSRRDRSASPVATSSRGLRRSDRLRNASNRESVGSKNVGKREKSASVGRRGSVQAEVGSTSLEVLAPNTISKDFVGGGRSRFEKQQERHGITEALRLKNLRWRQKVDKARQRSDQQRWGNEGGEVREGARLDAIIDQISTFDFSTPAPVPGTETESPAAMGPESSHPAVETRKKKSVRHEKRERFMAACAKNAMVRSREREERERGGGGIGAQATGGDMAMAIPAATTKAIPTATTTVTAISGGGDDEMADINPKVDVDVKQQVPDPDGTAGNMEL